LRLLTITHYPALLGANRSLLHLVIGLRDLYGVEILVFCPKAGPFTEALQKNGIPFIITPFVNWAYTIRSFGLLKFPLKWHQYKETVLPNILERVISFNPDVIHSNSSAVALGWQIAESLRKPHIWHIREFGWKDYQLVFPLGRKRLLEKLQQASAVICISRAIAKEYAAAIEHPHIIYNGIGTTATIKNNFQTGQQATYPDALFHYLIIGLLQPSKRQHDALTAFARVYKKHPNVRLMVVGNGQRLYTLRLKLIARWLGIASAVEFTGYVPLPGPIYAAADIVLICSHYEAMGRVTAEAMSYGKPVIGYNGGATPELIEDGVNGWLYNDVTGLAEKMEAAYLLREKCAKMGKNGVKTALEKFSDEVYVRRFYETIFA